MAARPRAASAALRLPGARIGFLATADAKLLPPRLCVLARDREDEEEEDGEEEDDDDDEEDDE